jgi:hypothetical protein
MFFLTQRLADFPHRPALGMLMKDPVPLSLYKSFDKLKNDLRLNSIQVVKRLKNLKFLVSGCHKVSG